MTSYRKSNTGGDFNGYPGLFHLAAKVMDFVPRSGLYVEPFAGLGRTVKYARSGHMNDMSDYAVKQLRRRYPNHTITQEDFALCARRWDSVDTVMLFDPPYRTETYSANEYAYIDRTAREYYTDLLELCQTLKSKWFVVTDGTGTGASIWSKTTYPKVMRKSKTNVLFGKKAHILLFSNHKLVSQQTCLEVG